MRRALPTIALSAAGVTWLLHAQGVIDASGAPGALTTGPVESSGSARTPTTGRGPSSSTTTTTARGGRGPTTTSPRTATPPTTPPTTAPAGGAATGVAGTTVNTKFGPVQVAVVVTSGQVTEITALQYPKSVRRSQQINDRALPVLRQEALTAQSANIDSVSGATITSDAYATSLQAALDAAGFRR